MSKVGSRRINSKSHETRMHKSGILAFYAFYIQDSEIVIVNQSGPENAILQLSFFMFFSKKNTSEILGQ
jgi:hypothetical protein